MTLNTNITEDIMKYKGYWSRWHRFDLNGVKYIRKFGITETPEPLIENGYTQWRRGTGPLSPEHYKNVSNAVRAFSLGKPKSETQKHKMRLAKLGIPKTPEHRENMRKAWEKKRNQKPEMYRQIFATMKNQP